MMTVSVVPHLGRTAPTKTAAGPRPARFTALEKGRLKFVGFALTAGCLALGAYVVDWPRTWEAIIRADPTLIALSLPCLLITFCLFALRWRELIAWPHRPPFWRIFNFFMIGYLANAVLPLRPGDAIRAVLLRRSQNISLSVGAASLVLERLFDVLAISALGVGLSLVVSLPPVVVTALYLFATVAISLIAILLFFSLRRGTAALITERFPRLLAYPIVRFAIEWLSRFVSAIGVIHSSARLASSVTLTCLAWGMLAVFLMILIKAFALPAPVWAALLILVVTNLGAAIPSSPGSIGVYHFLAVLALSVWSVDTSIAVAFAISSHALTIGMHILIGLACAWFEGLRLSGLGRLTQAEDSADMMFGTG
jgi:glycosyltransferase 2 family protein